MRINVMNALKQANILIAEDQDQNRAEMAEILDMYGFKTYQACDGKDALTMIKNLNDISVYILDLKMHILTEMN